MRSRAVVLIFLMLMVPMGQFSGFDLVGNVSAADSVVNTDTTWSGNMALTGNVTVASGATLTLASGVVVDAGTYSITVDGALQAHDAVLYSSVTPVGQGSHGQGLWPGVIVSSSGSVVLDNLTVENAEIGIENYGTVSGVGLQTYDTYLGLKNYGDADFDDFEAKFVDYEAVYNAGNLDLSIALISDVTTAVLNEGFANISDMSIYDSGLGLQALSGSMTAHGLGLTGLHVGMYSQSGASLAVDSVTGGGVNLLVDASNSDDFSLSDVAITGKRLLLAQGASDYELEMIQFQSTLIEERAVVDSKCAGDCYFYDVEIWNASNGIALSGEGTHEFDLLNLSASDSGILSSGAGEVEISQSYVEAGSDLLSLRGPDAMVYDSTFKVLDGDGNAVAVLGGSHYFDGVVIQKQYSAFDKETTGLEIWHGELYADGLEVSGFAVGIDAVSSDLYGESYDVNLGKEVGISLEDSLLYAGQIDTANHDDGVVLDGESMLHTSMWTAVNHQLPLTVGDFSFAVIRDFVPQNYAASNAASGGGYLLYGASSTLPIATSYYDKFIETPVTFTDLASNPIEANISVHGFELTSDINGAADLPLLASGSEVDATYAGAGVRVELTGGQMGQSVQVPVIPEGDWTIASGQSVVLGPKPDGSDHIVSGDLTISSNAQLHIEGVTLKVESGNEISILGSGELTGDDATVEADNIYAGMSSIISGISEDGFEIKSDVAWSCSGTLEIEDVYFEGSLTLQPNCKIEMTRGEADGTVTVLTGGEFKVLSLLDITVLDKGDAVSGALIFIDGTSTQTDEDGKVATSATARLVTDYSDTVGGLKTIGVQRDSFTDFASWDSSQSLSHTFMISTVDSGTLNQWLVLESEWSPYFLDGDLTIGQFSTMTIHDGVSLRVSEGSKIIVDGILDAGSATISSTGQGARWGGLELGSFTSSTIDLSGTHLVEAGKALVIPSYGEVVADSVLFARSNGADPLLEVSSGASANVDIRNSEFMDGGSGCVVIYPSSGSFAMDGVSMENCNERAVWARQSNIEISDLSLGENITQGLHLTGVTGYLNGLDATGFNGVEEVIWMEAVDGDFNIIGVDAVANGNPAIAGNANRDIYLEDITISGAPAIDFDNTAGYAKDISLSNDGTGSGLIFHHGKTAIPMVFEGLEVANYAVGIDLHADIGENPSTLIIRDADLWASTAISAEHYAVRVESGAIVGSVDTSGVVAQLVDIDTASTSYNAAEGGISEVYSSVVLDARLDGVQVSATYTIDTNGIEAESQVVSGTSPLVEILVAKNSEARFEDASSLTITVDSEGLPQFTHSQEIGEMGDIILMQLVGNAAPELSITAPYAGQRIMQSSPFNFTVTASDDLDSAEQISFTWIITNSMAQEVANADGDEPLYALPDIPAGLYVLEVVATDTLGASSSQTIDFEITQLDSDGDTDSSCNTETWRASNYYCGPDIYDLDDDNDGINDERDAFPLDACASVDTDEDGMPDTIDCPNGVTTTLFEDQDDDGDGVPDSHEGVDMGSSGISNAMVMIITVLVVVGLLVILRGRKGSGGEFNIHDERHL